MRQIKIGFASILMSFKLIRFFIGIDDDAKIRKFYRHMISDNFFRRLKNLIHISYFLCPLYRVLDKKAYILIFAEYNGEIIAICHVNIDLKKKTGLYGAVVKSEFQGKKIGKLITLLAFKYAISLGTKYIILSVDVDNYIAIKFYKKLGFKTIKVIKKGDFRQTTREYVDVIEMAIPLRTLYSIKGWQKTLVRYK